MFAGGEPAFHPDIYRLISNACNAKRSVQLTTNGIKIGDLHFCNGLRYSGLKEIRISYEAFNTCSSG